MIPFGYRLIGGIGVGAALDVAYGNKDLDVGDRAAQGAGFGAIAGVAAPLAWEASKKLPNLGWSFGKGIASSSQSRFSYLRTKGLGVGQAFLGSYGGRFAFAGAGAALGAMIDSDHRERGAVIGAGVGFAARSAMHGISLYNKLATPWLKVGEKKFLRPGKWMFLGGVSALAVGAGLMTHHDRESQAVYNPATGYDATDPGVEEDYQHTGYSARMAVMQAGGGVVLGAHRGRHGS